MHTHVPAHMLTQVLMQLGCEWISSGMCWRKVVL